VFLNTENLLLERKGQQRDLVKAFFCFPGSINDILGLNLAEHLTGLKQI